MRISKTSWWHVSGQSHRLIGPVIVLTLATVGTLIYLLPGDTRSAADGGAAVSRTLTPSPTAGPPFLTPPPATPTTPATSPTGRPSTSPARSSTVNRPAGAQVIHETSRVITPGHMSTVTAASGRTTKAKHCWDFTWQQDAQVVYLANLSDPWGLDGDSGPDNGDGLACSTLPVDPNRAASKPIGAYEPPAASAAQKSALVAPTQDFWGVTEDGLPRAARQYNRIATEVDKAPSAIGFFSNWDTAYPAAQVQSSWQHGALPVLTWMSKPSDDSSAADYSITKILAGDWDDYLYKFAGDVVRTNLPVVIRFDHEMNGAWYPWSAGRSEWNNSPAKYVAMWRYVWNIFQKVGANDDVIWLYSPARVDNIAKTPGISSVADDYPGDDYVDWVGATVYWRNGAQATDYKTSFGKTIAQLRALTAKPLFFAEVGALERYKGADVSAAKQDWIRNTLAGFLADPSVVGFSWFNNVATTGEDPLNPHDWRFDASAATLAAFKQATTDPRFAAGIRPDPTGG